MTIPMIALTAQNLLSTALLIAPSIAGSTAPFALPYVRNPE